MLELFAILPPDEGFVFFRVGDADNGGVESLFVGLSVDVLLQPSTAVSAVAVVREIAIGLIVH